MYFIKYKIMYCVKHIFFMFIINANVRKIIGNDFTNIVYVGIFVTPTNIWLQR